MPSPDDVIAGKYRLVEMLGEGGMGTVWIAENQVLRKRVALKLMSGGTAREVAHVDRFLREAIAASRVRHPAIVDIHDAGNDHGVPWIAMELLDGESLAKRLARRSVGLQRGQSSPARVPRARRRGRRRPCTGCQPAALRASRGRWLDERRRRASARPASSRCHRRLVRR